MNTITHALDRALEDIATARQMMAHPQTIEDLREAQFTVNRIWEDLGELDDQVKEALRP